jgi:hypothetical protein
VTLSENEEAIRISCQMLSLTNIVCNIFIFVKLASIQTAACIEFYICDLWRGAACQNAASAARD